MADFTDFESLERHFRWLLQRHCFRCFLILCGCFLAVETAYLAYLQATSSCCLISVAVSASGLGFLALCAILFIPKLADWFHKNPSIPCLIIGMVFATLFFILICTDRGKIVTIASVYVMLHATLISYTLLPWKWELSCVCCILANAVQLLVLLILDDKSMGFRTVQNIMFLLTSYICVNVMGILYKILFGCSIQRAFRDTKNCVESRIKLEHERQQQEHLLLSVMPAHLADEMRKKMIDKLRLKPGLSRRKSAYGKFHEMYIRIHENVSILYADIVNFTPLASGISASDLVTLLNELFGRFDKIAQENNCIRIKILGDCYYCVSGLPMPQPFHARNCVLMGLGMIQVIKEVREATGSNVDMRIGIHTGVVLSGVIGLKKWQYDVWSDDVTIANYLESSGCPGKIHLSEATLKELHEEYKIEENDFENLHPYVQKKKIKTYFIDPEENSDSDKAQKDKSGNKKSTLLLSGIMPINAFKNISKFLAKYGGVSKPFAAASDKSTSERLICSSLEQMEQSMQVLRSPKQCFKNKNVSGSFGFLGLHGLNCKRECESWRFQDRYFAHTVITLSLLCIILTLVMVCSTHEDNIEHILGYGLSVTVVLVLLVVVSVNVLVFRTGRQLLKKVKFLKVKLVLPLRMSIFAVLVMCFYLPSVILLYFPFCDTNTTSASIELGSNSTTNIMWCRAYSDTAFHMALWSLITFLQISYLVKLTMALLLSSIHIVVFYMRQDNMTFASSITPVSTIMLLLITANVMHQTEIAWKLGCWWRRKFRVEKDDVELTGALNKILLENILPFHVADHFLHSPKGRTEELYHESYEQICVMFASIPNFWEFYEQSAVTRHGIECIRILNEIICDFDQLLLKPKFSSMDKIKAIGSTYMAASGLQRGRQTKKRVAQNSFQRQDLCVIVVVDFARAMIEVLSHLNKNSFTQFKLRIGINHGPAIAGVIGAQKPQYDIWGDTVNVASRMESNGVMDHIHCREETAEILRAADYSSVCRGPIKIKGKTEPIITYLLQ